MSIKPLYLVSAALLLLTMLPAKAQKIAIAERTPALEVSSWLREYTPAQHDYSCIVFIHSASMPCIESLNKIQELTKDVTDRLQVTVITKERREDAVGIVLTRLVESGCGVAFDNQGATFRSFGIKYTPFCVISDRKRRAVWFGNPQQLTAEQIKELLK